MLAWAVPADAPGGLALRVGLVAGVLTQAVVGTAAWLFLGFAVSALPSVAMTFGVAVGAHHARLARRG